MKTIFAISIIAIALIAVACTGAPPAEPGWPADALAYVREVGDLKNQIVFALPNGWIGSGSSFIELPIDPEEARQSADEIGDAFMAIFDLKPPPALLPYHHAVLSVATECGRAVNNAARLNSDSRGPASELAIIILRDQCIDALAIANLELDRYAATVGGYPPME